MENSCRKIAHKKNPIGTTTLKCQLTSFYKHLDWIYIPNMKLEKKNISPFWLQEDCGEGGTETGKEFITVIYQIP